MSTPAPVLLALVAATRLGERAGAIPRAAAEVGGDLTAYIRAEGVAATMVVAGLALYALPFVAMLTWTPAALTRLFGVTPSENGLGLAAGLACGCLLGVALASWLMRRYRPTLGARAPLRISAVTLLASLPLGLAYVFVVGKVEAFLIVGLLMASGTLIGSLLPGIIQGLAPPDLRGRVVAIHSIVAFITGGLGVSVVGPASDLLHGDRRSLLIGVAVLLWVSWLLSAFLMWRSEGRYERLILKFEASAELAA